MRPPVNSSALHVLQTLRLVCVSETPLSHAEISRRTSFPSTTVYRALSTLEDAQYIQRAQGSLGYEAGIVPQLLLWTMLRRFPLSTEAIPFLSRLAALSGGTASVCVRLGWYGLRVCVVYGGNDVYHRDRLGEVSLLHAAGATRGIFAFLSDHEIEDYRRFVQRHHDSPDINRPSLRRDAQATRSRGYDALLSEGDDESTSFAMPLRDANSQVVGAIALSASSSTTGAELPEAWRAVWLEFGAFIAAEPARTASPYGHIPTDDIVIKFAGGR